MKILPHYLLENYQELARQSDEEKKSRLLTNLFDKSLALLGKLALLEYVQGSISSSKIDYWLLSEISTVEKPTWLHVLRKLLFFFKEQQCPLVLFPLQHIWEKFPYLQDQQSEDKLKRLTWFYQAIAYDCPFALSSSDLSEYEEQLTLFLHEFSFFAEIKFKVEEGQSKLVYQDKILLLAPFYLVRLVGSKGLQIYPAQKTDLKNFYGHWLEKEYTKYQREKRGLIDFTPLIENHRKKYVLVPRLELQLQETFEEILALPDDITIRDILVEGPPAVGKTALAANLSRIIGNDCDILNYFVVPDTVYQQYDVFKRWFFAEIQKLLLEETIEPPVTLSKLQKSIAKTDKKIVIAVDGIEFFPQSEFVAFRKFIKHQTLSPIVFILFKRSFANNSLAVGQTVKLTTKDNLYFSEHFTPAYKQKLLTTYISTPLAKKIYDLLAKNNDYVNISQLAEKFAIYTPKILKCIVKMKPLLNIVFFQDEQHRENMYFRLFDPILSEGQG